MQTPRWTRAYFSTLFDAADPDQTIGKRNVTAVAPQALFFMNHPFVRSQADALARHVIASSANGSASGSLPNFTARLSRAYELLFNRTPTGDEVAIAADFLRDSKAGPRESRLGRFDSSSALQQ